MIDDTDISPTNKIGGTNFRDQKLRILGDTAFIEPTVRSRLIIALFGFGGYLFFGFFVFMFLIGEIKYETKGMLIFVSILAIYSSIIFWVYRKVSVVSCLNTSTGFYYIGAKQNEASIPLRDVALFAVVRKTVYSSSSSFNSYELLMILNDKKKIKLIDHNGRDEIKEEAKLLAKFLGVECRLLTN